MAAQQHGSAGTQQGVSELDAKVVKLSTEVVSELQALASHQDELRFTKANLQNLSEQMDTNMNMIAGCQKAVIDVKENVEQLRSQNPGVASPGVPSRSNEDSAHLKRCVKEWSRAVPHGKSSMKAVGGNTTGSLASAAVTPTPLQPQPARNIEEEAQEVSDSYDNEAFDEADEDSMSAS